MGGERQKTVLEQQLENMFKNPPAGILKDIKIDEFKNCFEQWKKVLIGVLHQMESNLKVTEV